MKLYILDRMAEILIGLFSSLISCLLILILFLSLSSGFTANAQEEMWKSIQIINPRPDFSLSLRLNKGIGATYAPGEIIRVFFRSDRNVYVTLLGYEPSGSVQILFPNQNQKKSFVENNHEYSIDRIVEQGLPAGIEYIQGFATIDPVMTPAELEKMLAEESSAEIDGSIHHFVQRLRETLTKLPTGVWVSSEIIRYQIVEHRPETGQFIMHSSPEGSEVFLNNRYAGKTPLDINQVPTGEYIVRVELPGYQTWTRTIQIHQHQSTFLSADLQGTQQFGSIAIRCNKDIARIYLDNQFRRITNQNREVILEDIIEGFHDIRIVLNGYYDWTQGIEVNANQRIPLTVNLEKIDKAGSIEISCNVDDAMIYLDGNYRERTSSERSVIISDIPEGSYEIRVERKGYQDYTAMVTIRSDDIPQIKIQMQQKLLKEENGVITIYCNEKDARIFVDGMYTETTSTDQATFLEELEEGSYDITVIKEGYHIWQEEVYVYPGEKTSIFADLVKAEK